MSDTDFEKLLEFAYTEVLNGKNYEQIAKDLHTLSTDSKLIDSVLEATDQYIAEYQIATQKRDYTLIRILVGIILLALGSATAYLSDSIQGYVTTIASTFIASGFYMIYNGYDLYKQPITSFMEGKNTSMFRQIKSGR